MIENHTWIVKVLLTWEPLHFDAHKLNEISYDQIQYH